MIRFDDLFCVAHGMALMVYDTTYRGLGPFSGILSRMLIEYQMHLRCSYLSIPLLFL
jgi:hypothetical protein